jgi:hypothetical protein
MRQVVVLLMVMGCVAPHATALQAGRSAAGAPAVRACALLTREVLTAVTAMEKQSLALSMQVPPTEDALGATGSACSYGDVVLQIDPFTPARLEQLRTKEWVPLQGVGDTAYFRDNRGRFAELYAQSGRHVITIQMSVPTGRTAASIQPNVIRLANAILPKLK